MGVSLAFVTLAVATAFTAPAFASVLNAKDKTECVKAGGVWSTQPTNARPRNRKRYKEAAAVGGLFDICNIPALGGKQDRGC